MNLSSLPWQSLTLNHPFRLSEQAVDFFDFQPNAQQAITQFQQSPFGSALVVKTSMLPETVEELAQQLSNRQTLPLITQITFDRKTLFGSRFFLEKENRIESVAGAIQSASGGILLLNLNALLADITQWDKLKQALLFGTYEAEMLTPTPDKNPSISVAFKLVLMGSREDIATLFAYDESLYQFAQYTEIDSYLSLDEERLNQWGNFVQQCANKWLNRPLNDEALNALLRHFVRESESKRLISLCPTQLKKHLIGIANFSENLTACDVDNYFASLEHQSATLNRYALDDILTEQVHIETEGEAVGQVNGLSVVEFDGVPHAFGEPLRISCNVQYGEGEIHDIERKVELGGHLHSKGILLAQSCLASLLELPTQLPFSASVAFEQSYGEVDGDSSSLAIFCVLISALAKLPLPQSMAITGAIDQKGNVLSVGGVNQKIEGFFDLCEVRQLTGKQGVIIPTACVSHLSLKPAVLEAVKSKQFHIWAVSDVFEALWILFEHYFYEDDKPEEDKPEDHEKNALYSLIHQEIEQNENNASETSFWTTFLALLTKWKKH